MEPGRDVAAAVDHDFLGWFGRVVGRVRIVVLAMAVIVLVACGSPPPPSPPPSASIASAPGPTATPPSPSPGSGSPSGGSPSGSPVGPPDLTAAVAALDRLDSYRSVVGTQDGRTTERWESVVVNRPIPAIGASSQTTAGTSRVVVIGERAWVADPGAAVREASLDEARSRLASANPAAAVAPFAGPVVAAALRSTGQEERNGTVATRYDAPAAALAEAGLEVSPDAYVRVWLARDGRLVALESSGVTGPTSTVGVEITAANDPANVVEAPQ